MCRPPPIKILSDKYFVNKILLILLTKRQKRQNFVDFVNKYLLTKDKKDKYLLNKNDKDKILLTKDKYFVKQKRQNDAKRQKRQKGQKRHNICHICHGHAMMTKWQKDKNDKMTKWQNPRQDPETTEQCNNDMSDVEM